MRVTIRGTTYDTVQEAAEAHGVSVGHVYTAVAEGRQDKIGIGMGNWRKPRDRFDGNRIVLFGVEFKSMTAASLELGFKDHYIRGALMKKSPKGMVRIREAIALKKGVAPTKEME